MEKSRPGMYRIRNDPFNNFFLQGETNAKNIFYGGGHAFDRCQSGGGAVEV
ncbi:MAG: hypothetical protein IKD46_03820 [Lentisphaeria bacterium]|nr:hypothetical protein [Lentisphaeria bacterium]